MTKGKLEERNKFERKKNKKTSTLEMKVLKVFSVELMRKISEV